LVTDDPFIHQVLLAKFENAKHLPNNAAQSVFAEPLPVDLYRVQSFVLSVVSRLVSDDMLSQLSMADIIAYRKENADGLIRFRREMAALAANLNSQPGSASFRSEILRTIDRKILPLVDELDDTLKNSYVKLFGSISGNLGASLAKGAAGTIPTLTVAALLGMTPAHKVIVTAAALMTAIGIALPDIVKFWEKRGEKKRNGICYLLNFRKLADKWLRY
jgi:hypothetical protein